MSRYAGNRSMKTGMAPGTLVHTGKRKTKNVSVSVIEFDENTIKHIDVDDPGDLAYFRDSDKTSWVNINGLHDTSLLGSIGTVFGLHPLVLEDMLDTQLRPKIEDYGEYIYIVIKQLYINESDGGIVDDQQSIILGKGFVISASESKTKIFDPLRERLENGGKIRKMKADFLAYSILDAVIDNYSEVLESLSDKIEIVEELLVSKPVPDTLNKINDIKKDTLFIHKNIWPLREVTNLLERMETHLIQGSTRLYMRDLYDHVIQSMDTTDIYREILSGLLDIYLSSLSYRMNEIMKVLTIISTIFIPLTFITGIYGMNFRYMPGIGWHWGFFAMIGLMVTVVAGMLAFFMRRKWL